MENLKANVLEKMNKAFDYCHHTINSVRSGGACPTMLDPVLVEVHGENHTIKSIASIVVRDALHLAITPWDIKSKDAIVRAVGKANIGLGVVSEADKLIVSCAPMSQERRVELAKVCSSHAEAGRVVMRQVRREFIDKIKLEEKNKEISKDDSKRNQKIVSELHDEMIKKINDFCKKKEDELLKRAA